MASVLSLEGRMEKRLPIAIVVYLAQAQNQSIKEPELAYTDNISTHGACVISSRTWKLGEVVEVSSLKDQMALCGKVVHCEKRNDDRYAVGLAFNGFQVTWSKYRSYSGT
jgi:hypothetical protein